MTKIFLDIKKIKPKPLRNLKNSSIYVYSYLREKFVFKVSQFHVINIIIHNNLYN